MLTLSAAAILGWFSVSWLAVRAHGQIAVRNQGYIPYSDAPIFYRSENLSDPVALLEKRIERRKVTLKFDPQFGYLKSVLKELKVPVDSQTLVYSKTSFQYPKISPDHPRALYYNDDVYVGKVHNGKAIEIVAFDPTQGAIFYLLDERRADHPVFQRAELDCTQCHIAAGTRGVPGVLLRSVYPTSTGMQALNTQAFITDQDSPLKDRWGGWYVTGNTGGQTSLANAVVNESADQAQSTGSGQEDKPIKLTSLPAKTYDPAAYLTPDSDVVAHLVLAHQTQMHNLITLTNYKTRIALYNQAEANKRNGLPENAPPPENLRKQFELPAEQLLRYLLFVNEAPLPGTGSEKIGGVSPFAIEFARRGLRDHKGRSLRDFDLKTRIFRYPCSYLIYSESFDAIPELAKNYIYHRLFTILTGQDNTSDFAKLTPEERRAILEILLATKPGLPEEWSTYATSNHLRLAATHQRHDGPRQDRSGLLSSTAVQQGN